MQYKLRENGHDFYHFPATNDEEAYQIARKEIERCKWQDYCAEPDIFDGVSDQYVEWFLLDANDNTIEVITHLILAPIDQIMGASITDDWEVVERFPLTEEHTTLKIVRTTDLTTGAQTYKKR